MYLIEILNKDSMPEGGMNFAQLYWNDGFFNGR